MSRLRRIRQRVAAAAANPTPAPVITCLRCKLEYAEPLAQDGKCICVNPIPSRDGRTPLPGVATDQERYYAIIAHVAHRSRP